MVLKKQQPNNKNKKTPPPPPLKLNKTTNEAHVWMLQLYYENRQTSLLQPLLYLLDVLCKQTYILLIKFIIMVSGFWHLQVT